MNYDEWFMKTIADNIRGFGLGAPPPLPLPVLSYCCHFVDGPMAIAAGALGMSEWIQHIANNNPRSLDIYQEIGYKNSIHRYVFHGYQTKGHASLDGNPRCYLFRYHSSPVDIDSNAQAFPDIEL